MKFLIGLGNPTPQYAGTRHNIGFDAITRISDSYNIPVKEKAFKALVGRGMIEGEKVILVKPQTFMNLSGESVREVVAYYKGDAEDVLVFCDDINLEPGQLRIRAKGSAGGHNGLKNIIAGLGTENFARCRIGVGEKPEGWDLADYVLGHFPAEVEPLMREALKNAEDAAKMFVQGDIQAAMNLYNKKKGTASEK
ncbi:MAG: aminoacyl-tRNA hydrolase [Lachnospiraceae bacterium]|nr:aminoacyl-tRNA hydrolase [Lachnospiraceae bacterium]